MNVIVAKLSEGTQEFKLGKDATLEEALKKAGYADPKSVEEGTRVNGQELRLSAKLKEGDFITVSPQVKGGIA